MAEKNAVENLSVMWGLPRRKSTDILDTAEDLCDNLDKLADILTEIEDKYKNHDVNDDENSQTKTIVGVFTRLKDGLDTARNLINSLKREKWRLSRRKLSVEMRLGELDDYKSHLKQDMSNLNELVDVLSVRLIQLENTLVEEQETQEMLEAEKDDLKERLKASEARRQELELHKQELITELKELSRERSDASYKKENLELKAEMEIIMEENKQLKDMLRLKDLNAELDKGDLGSLGSVDNETKGRNSAEDTLDSENYRKPIADGRKLDKDNKL